MRLVTAALASALLAAPAYAADFTFDVPVVFTNVPSATSVAVSCIVSRVPIGGVGYASGGNVVGRSRETSLPITGGNLHTTVTIEVNADGLVPAGDARSYYCSLRFAGTGRTGATYAASTDNASEAYQNGTGARLERAVTRVSGSLP